MKVLFVSTHNNSLNIISKSADIVSSSNKKEHFTKLQSFQMNTFGEETIVLPPMTAFRHSANKTGHPPMEFSNGPDSQLEQDNSNNIRSSIMMESLHFHTTTSSEYDNDDETFRDDFELAQTESDVISNARRDDHKFRRMVGCLLLVGIIIGVVVAVLTKSPTPSLAVDNQASTSREPTSDSILNYTSIAPVTTETQSPTNAPYISNTNVQDRSNAPYISNTNIQNPSNAPYISNATNTPIYVVYNQTGRVDSSWIPQGKDSNRENKRNETWH